MVPHGVPGLRVPRKRVAVGSVMWMQDDSSIASWDESSMCKASGLTDFETSATSHSSVDGASNPASITIDFLDCKSDEGINTSIHVEPSIKHEVKMLATSPLDRVDSGSRNSIEEINLDLYDGPNERQDMEGVEEEEADSEPKEIRVAAPDEGEEYDMSLDLFFKILQDPLEQHEGSTLPGKLRPEAMSQPTIDQELSHAPLFNQEVSSSSAHRSDAKEIMFLHSSEQEGLQGGAQQMDHDGFLFDTLSTQEPSQPGTGLFSQHISGHDFTLLPSPERQASQSETLSDHETNPPSFDLNPNEDSWHSASSILHEGTLPSLETAGSGAQETTFGSSSHLSILDNGAEEQSSENIIFVDAPRSFGHALSSQPGYTVDHDRPRQTYGSVLASEVKFTERTLESAGMAMPLSTGVAAVHKQVTSRPNVVDLTEDSDDDTVEYVTQPDPLRLHVKRRTQIHLEANNRKRPNISGGSSEQSGKDDYDYKAQVSGSPHRWNIVGASHVPSHDGSMSLLDHSVRLVGGRSVQFSNGCVENIADRGNSMQLSTSYDVSTKRSLPVASGVLTTPESFMKRSLVGSNREEATPDEGLLSVPLLKHQRLALAWMVNREVGGVVPRGGILADDQGLGKTISTISLILKARAPMQKNSVEDVDSSRPGAFTVELEDDDDPQAAGRTEAVTPSVNEKHDSSLPPTLDNEGIGLGLQNTEEDVKAVLSQRRPIAGTLVVCPTSVLRQWAHELKEKVTKEAGLSVLIYHGSNRTRDPEDLAKYDVVLTTYSIVSMEVPKQPLPEEKDNEKKTPGSGDSDFPPPFRGPSKAKKSKKATDSGKKSRGNGKGRLVEGENGSVDSGPLARVNWFRVVLDEAQSIKNARTQVARAAWGLRAKRRWCLSGTPIQNAIDDLYSYFRFLRYYPVDAYKSFRELIKDPVTRTPAEGYVNLQKILKDVMLRRTKGTTIDGKPIVDLPPRIVTLKQAEFSDDERAFYTALENESRKQFQDYAAAGTLQSNYVNILWMLLRLRQACDHPLLVKGHKYQGAQKIVLDSAKKLPAEKRMHLLSLLEANREICSICSDLPDEAVVCVCTHIFCKQCIFEQLATGDDTCCPIPKCRKSLNTSLVFSVASLKNSESGEGSSSGSSLFLEGAQHEECNKTEDVDWKSSSKIDAVIDTLSALPPVYVIVENGRVVVQASIDLKDVKLVDTSGIRNMRPEPLLLADHEAGSLAKVEPLPVVKGEPVSAAIESTSNMTGHVSTKIEDFELGQADRARKTETVTTYSSAAVKGVKQESVTTDIVSIREPLTRRIVESTEKAIVFSQWTSMLDLLELKLKEAKFNYRRLDGTMSVVQRDRAVSEFKTLPEVTVIIMSLKAASLGLNMVAACHVLLLDVWWNPTTEDQAIDRAHRIGQTRTVQVSRFTVKNTIEDRILELQAKKRRMVASAFGENDGGGQSRLTREDFEFLFRV